MISTDPVFPFNEGLSEDGRTLEIKFVNYIMPNYTEFTIKLHVMDPAGNEANLEYSFRTMAKEDR